MSIVVDDTSNGLSDDAAVAALVNQMKVDPKGPAANSGEEDEDTDPDLADEADENEGGDEDQGEAPDDDEADEDEDEASDEDGDEDEDGEAEQEAPAAAPALTDDAKVKVVVNGEETEVTVGSLKRLAGQEAALTRKSQEADQVGGRAAFMIQGALELVAEDLAPYQDIDWLVAQQEMEPEEFKWHRDNFARSQKRHQALVQQAQEFEGVVSKRRQAAQAEQAKEATVELAKDIPNWSDKLYGDIMQYGIEQGLDANDVAQITNAKVIKLLHKAMVADRAQAVAVKKIKQAPVRVKRPSASDEASANTSSRQQRRLEQKLKSGRATDDDAVALLMGRWKK